MKPLLSFVTACVLIAPAPAQELFTHIGAIEQGLSAITGLAFKHEVPYALITKDQLRKYLDKRLRSTMKPAEVRKEELTLEMLGLVPADFDLRKSTLELLTEQAAAFYDYNQKRLYILEGSSGGDEERVALIHELAHALADQHFHLAKYIHEGLKSDDDSTARQAVMEGQATWLMAAYLARQAGGPAEIPAAVIELMKKTVESTAVQQYPVFSRAPLYIRESLVFPYAEGMAFQDAVYRKLGKEAFSEVFVRPPLSSGQILHPERYLDHAGITIPDPPAAPDANQFHKLADGTLGEFDFRVLLTQYTSAKEGDPAAEHLAGASYELLENKRDGYPLMAVASAWDSAKAARRYFELCRRVMQGKWKKFEVTAESADRIEGRGDSGNFRVWVDGATVNQIEGLRSEP
ncbi:MAG TPA: hypothetical protein VME17_00525 [Bryobacteraceae bacterium]|nr:hypothetical protein [Bryobacteraceae bacterium]